MTLVACCLSLCSPRHCIARHFVAACVLELEPCNHSHRPMHHEESLSESPACGLTLAASDPSLIVQDLDVAESLRDSISRLPEREGRILALRYGFYDGVPRTLEEIIGLQ